MRTAVTITISDRASDGIYPDRSGETLQSGLQALGYEVIKHYLVRDKAIEITNAISQAIDMEVDLIATTGGTGVSNLDITPEATKPLIEKELPGVSEALRAYGREQVITADLSRGLAGTARKSFIINLPGSSGGVKDGLVIIERLASHIHDQLAGYDHGIHN